MNERFVGIYSFRNTTSNKDKELTMELVIIDKKKLFNKDNSFVTDLAWVTDPDLVESGWCRVEGVPIGEWEIVQMEPGKSVRLAVEAGS
jgi:hypothetical protein